MQVRRNRKGRWKQNINIITNKHVILYYQERCFVSETSKQISHSNRRETIGRRMKNWKNEKQGGQIKLKLTALLRTVPTFYSKNYSCVT